MILLSADAADDVAPVGRISEAQSAIFFTAARVGCAFG
jgi:hypothetical protein